MKPLSSSSPGSVSQAKLSYCGRFASCVAIITNLNNSQMNASTISCFGLFKSPLLPPPLIQLSIPGMEKIGRNVQQGMNLHHHSIPLASVISFSYFPRLHSLLPKFIRYNAKYRVAPAFTTATTYCQDGGASDPVRRAYA